MFRWNMPQFVSVVQGQTAICNLRRLLGNALPRLHLELGGGLTKANCTKIRLKLNDKTIFEVSGSDLDLMEKYDAHPGAAAYLTLAFDAIRARDIVSQHASTLDLSNPNATTLYLEVDLNPAAGAGITLSAFADVMPSLKGSNSPLAAYANLSRVLLFTPVPITNAAAELPINFSLGSHVGAQLRRIWLFHTGQLTDVRLKKGSVDHFDKTITARLNYTSDRAGHDPQANVYVMDFIEDDNLSESRSSVNPDGTPADWQILVSTAAAESLRVYVDAIAPPLAI